MSAVQQGHLPHQFQENEMNARQFHNALRILRSIETDELLSFGVIDENWGAFIADLYTEALRMPDANFDRLYALIESRQPNRSA